LAIATASFSFMFTMASTSFLDITIPPCVKLFCRASRLED
jgi:hypothetical protein